MQQSDIDNRFTYHPPTEDQPARYEAMRAIVKTAAEFINEVCPESREKSSAVTHLEEAVFWANASIARNPADTVPEAVAPCPKCDDRGQIANTDRGVVPCPACSTAGPR